ncbi:MAG: hypothetical protein AAGH72_00875 [Verrucomicrobiota bacterium]
MLKQITAVIILLGWVVALYGTSYAFLLDWASATPDYPTGDLDHTFTNVDSSGVDIRVRITGRVANIDSGAPNDDTLGLFLAMDQDTNQRRIRMTVDFYETGTLTAFTMNSVSFSIYDIDLREESALPNGPFTFRDEIRFDIASEGAAPTSVTAAGGTDGPLILTGAGGRQIVRGTNTTDNEETSARLDVVFSNVSSYSFRYGNHRAVTQNDPVFQQIFIGNTTFVVPEASGVVALLVLAGFAAARRRFSGRQRMRSGSL